MSTNSTPDVAVAITTPADAPEKAPEKDPAASIPVVAKGDAKKKAPKKAPKKAAKITKKAPEKKAAKSTKKSNKKKASKKTSPKKSAKGSNGKAPQSKNAVDCEKAKTIGLRLVHYRVLRALEKSPDEMTYRDIEKATGYYSILAEIMHTDEEHSLVGKGLALDRVCDVNGRDKMAFVISDKGRKLLAKVK